MRHGLNLLVAGTRQHEGTDMIRKGEARAGRVYLFSRSLS